MQMRVNAKRHNKTVPSYEELEKMFLKDNMECESCKKPLNWLSKEGSDSVITLQHDDSGEFKFLCLSCNTKHGRGCRDLIYSIKENESYCKSCDKVKDKSEFFKDKYKKDGLKSSCKDCANKKVKNWKNGNKEKYNEYQRCYRKR